MDPKMAFFGPKIEKKVVNFWRRSPRCTLILPPKIRVFFGPVLHVFAKTAKTLFFRHFCLTVFSGTGKVDQNGAKKRPEKGRFSHFFDVLDPLWKFSCRLGVARCQKSWFLTILAKNHFSPSRNFEWFWTFFSRFFFLWLYNMKFFDHAKMIIFGSQKKSRFWPLFFIFCAFWKTVFLGHFWVTFWTTFLTPFGHLLGAFPSYFWELGVSKRGHFWGQKWTHFWGTSQKPGPKPLPVNSSVSRTIKFDPILGHFGPPKTSFLAFFGKKVIFWHFHEAKVRDSSIFDHFLKPVFWHVFDTVFFTKCSKSWFFLAF